MKISISRSNQKKLTQSRACPTSACLHDSLQVDFPVFVAFPNFALNPAFCQADVICS